MGETERRGSGVRERGERDTGMKEIGEGCAIGNGGGTGGRDMRTRRDMVPRR